MLASTILTDAILFKHEEQEKDKAMSAKIIRLDFQVSDHKKFWRRLLLIGCNQEAKKKLNKNWKVKMQ